MVHMVLKIYSNKKEAIYCLCIAFCLSCVVWFCLTEIVTKNDQKGAYFSVNLSFARVNTLENEFNQVSKQIAYRYCEINNLNSELCCNQLASIYKGLEVKKNELQSLNGYELMYRIHNIGHWVCQQPIEKRVQKSSSKYYLSWVNANLQSSWKWNNVWLKANSNSLLVKTVNASANKDIVKLKEIIKANPQYLLAYYHLLPLLNKSKNYNQLDIYERKYMDEALKQKAWDHLNYLSDGSMWGGAERLRSNGTYDNAVIDFLKRGLNPKSEAFDLKTRD